MAMSKKDFIAMADAIRTANQRSKRANGSFTPEHFSPANVAVLADFCQSQNPAFKRERWLGYIRGENGKNGGSIKTAPQKLPTQHSYSEVQL
jgi:hypothetical protein